MKKGSSYKHADVERRWRDEWERVRLNALDLSKAPKPYYNLMMFPYPSAEGLHVGNMYAFTGSDVFGRFKRMQGFSVFEPIGLDGFGIHSENYALKIGRHPIDHAKITQKNFYIQLHKIGSMYDWSRTLETYDPSYYRWTQWLFVQMYKRGLAYRGKASVNWCPSCKTVLADEQVLKKADAGKTHPDVENAEKIPDAVFVCERCGNIVEKKLMEQWFFRITAYAEKLLTNLRKIDWSEKVKNAQFNWIGKKEGIEITYRVINGENSTIGHVTCYTTRPDTNFGATFVVLAPEHEFITQVMRVINKEKAFEIGQYVNQVKRQISFQSGSQGRGKTGVNTGLYCINELTGFKMPLYISDFVMENVGTGAVVGVPGHDKRDYEFAKTFNEPIKRVVVASDGFSGPITDISQVQEDEGTMINSEFLNGKPIAEAKEEMMNYLVKKGWGKRVVTYHLRDWLISRQRYWGPPIPMVFCKACQSEKKGWFNTEEAKSFRAPTMAEDALKMYGWYPVSETDLPVMLPRIEDYRPGNDGIAPLAKHKEFYETTCPGCGKKAVRETDVSDTFLDSSWYFLRYPSVKQTNVKRKKENVPWDPALTKKWLPVHMYTGGAEHSVLHLMYSRFITMMLHDGGYLDFDEPFTKFYAHGLVIKDGAKMSKSKGNVVNPDEYIDRYGADALRLYLMFMGPFSQGGDFRDTAMEGMSRWIGRVWRLATASMQKTDQKKLKELTAALQKVVGKVTRDTENRHYNTAIAAMMEFTNWVSSSVRTLDEGSLKIFVLILAPFAPHLAEELWQKIFKRSGKGFRSGLSVHTQSWPKFSGKIDIEETADVVIQINGKLRDIVSVPIDIASDQERVQAVALGRPKVKMHLQAAPKKVIFISGKLLNFVV